MKLPDWFITLSWVASGLLLAAVAFGAVVLHLVNAGRLFLELYPIWLPFVVPSGVFVASQTVLRPYSPEWVTATAGIATCLAVVAVYAVSQVMPAVLSRVLREARHGNRTADDQMY